MPGNTIKSSTASFLLGLLKRGKVNGLFGLGKAQLVVLIEKIIDTDAQKL